MLNKIIPWEIFRADAEKIYDKEVSHPQGRRPYDVVLMCKILVLQGLYNFSDESAEYLITDRLSFQKFLEIQPDQNVPDARTIWLFREKLKKNNIYEKLFKQFSAYLTKSGYEAKGGQIVDASFAESPKQRNTREENEKIKETGKPIEDWSDKKKAHKDTDARWAMKNKHSYFGYKNHVNIDYQHRFIRTFAVTGANVHDSKQFIGLLNPRVEDKRVWADSAYSGKEIAEHLVQMGLDPRICEKGGNKKELTEVQKELNHAKSQFRCRVEHVFGFLHQASGGQELIRTIGLERAKIKITFRNLAHNIFRLCQLEKGKLCPEGE